MTTTEETTDAAAPTILLSQAINTERRAKSNGNKALSQLQKDLKQKLAQMTGYLKTYRPLDPEDLEVEPTEQTNVQIKAEDILSKVQYRMTDMWDVILTREAGNTTAFADIVVGETVIARDVPVTFLLGLGKQLDDLMSILRDIPVHDPAETWTPVGDGTYAAAVRTTKRTKKIPYSFQLAPATDKHQGQFLKETEDRITGYYERIAYTGTVLPERKARLIERLEALQRAVLAARERGNHTMVPKRSIGRDLFDYLNAP